MAVIVQSNGMESSDRWRELNVQGMARYLTGAGAAQ